MGLEAHDSLIKVKQVLDAFKLPQNHFMAQSTPFLCNRKPRIDCFEFAIDCFESAIDRFESAVHLHFQRVDASRQRAQLGRKEILDYLMDIFHNAHAFILVAASRSVNQQEAFAVATTHPGRRAKTEN